MIVTKNQLDELYNPNDRMGVDMLGADLWRGVKGHVIDITDKVASGIYSPYVDITRNSPFISSLVGYNHAAAVRMFGRDRANALSAELGGVMDFLQPLRKIASGAISIAKDSGVPIVSQVASGIREGNKYLEQFVYNYSGKDISEGGKYTPTTSATAATVGGIPTWLIILGVGGFAYAVLKKKKKSR